MYLFMKYEFSLFYKKRTLLMLSNLIGCFLKRHRIDKLLSLIFLVLFIHSPLNDACLHCYYFSPAEKQDINDTDNQVSINDLKRTRISNPRNVFKKSLKRRNNEHTRAQRMSLRYGSRGRITKTHVPANDRFSYQLCSLVFSDSSPPVI
jgi:hypothetical protein